MRNKRNKLCGQGMLVLMCIVANATATISISSFTASQIEGTKHVAINFDVSNTAASSVSVSVLVSNGVSPVAATTFSGHIGNNVPSGTNRQVIWHGGADYPDNVTSNLSITLQVSDPAPAGMVRIPAGSNSGLTVASFMMDATEITKIQWDVVANSTNLLNATDGSGKAPNHPVHFITWFEAAKWCNARSAQEGLIPCYNPASWTCNFSVTGYRLPTEVEWEYAARGGLNNQLYPWGNTIDHTNANYFSTEEDSFHPNYASGGLPFTSPVGSFDPNAFGLYDMSGNIFEWCNNIKFSGRGLRGGSWGKKELFQRCDNPTWATEGISNNEVGFRTVRNAPVSESQTTVITFDSRNYSLTVSSDRGSPIPAVGTTVYAWKASVPCSVDAMVNEGGSNYTCIGWTGTGGVPASGNTNSVVAVLSNLTSSLIWNWATDDTDLDQMDDDWELAYFGSLGQAATNDFDWDGQDNLSEFIAGTNPTNAASLFELSGNPAPGGFMIEWPTASNRTYNVYWTDNLSFTSFQPLETNITFPRNSATDMVDDVRGYYKVDVRK